MKDTETNGTLAGAAMDIEGSSASLNNHRADEQTSGSREFGLFELAVFSLASIGMLTVGFRIGKSKQMERTLLALDDDLMTSTSSLPSESAQHMNAGAKALPHQTLGRNKIQPSMPSGLLAVKALGYATILVASAATLTTFGVCYLWDIRSLQEFSDKLSHHVPKHGDRLQATVNPYLFSLKRSMESMFIEIKPKIFKRKDFVDKLTSEELEQEREELKLHGIDPSILDSYKGAVDK